MVSLLAGSGALLDASDGSKPCTATWAQEPRLQLLHGLGHHWHWQHRHQLHHRQQFQVTTGGSVGEIDFGVGYVAGFGNSFYLDIDADNSGQPGSVLASFTNLSSSTEFGTVLRLGQSSTAFPDSTSPPEPITGWCLARQAAADDTYDAWNCSNSATGLEEYSSDGGNDLEQQRHHQPQGAFHILGGGSGTTPEPTSLLLFGSGLLGVIGVFRRKMKF